MNVIMMRQRVPERATMWAVHRASCRDSIHAEVLMYDRGWTEQIPEGLTTRRAIAEWLATEVYPGGDVDGPGLESSITIYPCTNG